ncbi:MAG: hypothetical protein U5J95_00390 [Balneolaceae bacterium]|nr:hypothetical protein [Balneolaceae bacterium]
MSTYTREQLNRTLQNQINRLERRINKLQSNSKKLSRSRLFTFLVGTTLIFTFASLGSTILFYTSILLGIAFFGYLMHQHKKVDHAIQRFKIWKEIRSTHLSRMQLKWDNIPEKEIYISREQHAYATDLNIVGKHSLHQLIDTSIFKESSEKLLSWFLDNDPSIEAIKSRQDLAKELTPMVTFRDKIELRASLVKFYESEKDWSMGMLLKWLQKPSEHNYKTPLLILSTLSIINITLLVLWLIGVINPYVVFTFIAYLTIYNFNSDKVSGLFDNAYQIEKLLSEFSTILSYLENFSYRSPDRKLKDFCALYHESETRPSKFLKRIVRIAAAASSQSSEIIWFLLNAVMPWDMYFASKLESFKTDLEPKLSQWLDRFYELEALCSLANFKWLNPHYSFQIPQEPDDNQPALKALDLGHPLIPESEKVTNDVTIDSLGDILLITGSNMAGKSTFLRTIGINLALCFAGGPVNASTFETIPFRIFSSINVKDSLDQGLSHFYAEVKRLRKLMNALKGPNKFPLFFFVDEIYKGTNNRERLTGSTAFLKKVSGQFGIGLVSTHDLELAQLEEEIPTLSNYHFEETIEDGKMHFEYKLKKGPCPTTNALKIMEMEGLPVE